MKSRNSDQDDEKTVVHSDPSALEDAFDAHTVVRGEPLPSMPPLPDAPKPRASQAQPRQRDLPPPIEMPKPRAPEPSRVPQTRPTENSLRFDQTNTNVDLPPPTHSAITRPSIYRHEEESDGHTNIGDRVHQADDHHETHETLENPEVGHDGHYEIEPESRADLAKRWVVERISKKSVLAAGGVALIILFLMNRHSTKSETPSARPSRVTAAVQPHEKQDVAASVPPVTTLTPPPVEQTVNAKPAKPEVRGRSASEAIGEKFDRAFGSTQDLGRGGQ